jgi:hypothetical protein
MLDFLNQTWLISYLSSKKIDKADKHALELVKEKTYKSHENNNTKML